MVEYIIEKSFTNAGDRNAIRMTVVNEFSEEIQGKGI